MLVTAPNMNVRLSSLERGVIQLDNRISSLDSKVVEIILQNEKLAEGQEDGFRAQEDGFRDLHFQNENMLATIRKMKSQYTSKCQIYTFGIGLAVWTMFVAYIVWN
jgi:hypothetical protein